MNKASDRYPLTGSAGVMALSAVIIAVTTPLFAAAISGAGWGMWGWAAPASALMCLCILLANHLHPVKWTYHLAWWAMWVLGVLSIVVVAAGGYVLTN